MSKEDDAFPIRNSCPFKPFQVDIDFPSESNHALNIGFLMLEISFSSYTNSRTTGAQDRTLLAKISKSETIRDIKN